MQRGTIHFSRLPGVESVCFRLITSRPLAEESVMPAAVLILPGLGNSGPLHWQSSWNRHTPNLYASNSRIGITQFAQGGLQPSRQPCSVPGRMLCWSHTASPVWRSPIGRPHRTHQSRPRCRLQYPTPTAPTFPSTCLVSPRPPPARSHFPPSSLSAPMIRIAHRNTRSTLRRLGDAVSFISVLTATSTPAAALARGPRVMRCWTNCGAKPSFGAEVPRRCGSVRRHYRRAAL